VHGVGGIIGTLLAAVFAAPTLGVFAGQGFADGIDSITQQFSVQMIGVITVLLYTAFVTFVIFKVVSVLTKGLRVSEDEESEGLDIVSHEERGYDL